MKVKIKCNNINDVFGLGCIVK